MSHKTYLITAAVAGAKPNLSFLTVLTAYAKRLGAEVLVLPMVGARKKDVLDEQVFVDMGATIVRGDMVLNSNLSIRDFLIRPAAAIPLTGLSRFIQDGSSTIVAATKQFMKSVATLTSEPRMFYTTGACTEPDYSTTTAGNKARLDHVIGAVVVEVYKNGLFHARPVQWKQGNGITDLCVRNTLTRDGKVVKVTNHRAAAIVCGDWHTGDTHPVARAMTFEMFHQFEPRAIVLHDIFNGHSINHHERNKCISRAVAHSQDRLDLPKEIQELANELVEICKHLPKDCKVYIAQSNHDDWLARYLEAGHFTEDPQNLKLALILAAAQAEGHNPLEFAVRRLVNLPQVVFLKRGKAGATKICGYEVSQHGDAGANGSKGTTAQLEDMSGHGIVGHQHTPAMYRGLVVVGTNTRLDLPYVDGSPSSWLHANALINEDGSCQLLVMPEQRGCKWSATA